ARWRKFNVPGCRLALEVETVDDCGWFGGMNVHVHHFIEPVKSTRLEEGRESPVSRHGLLLSLAGCRVGVGSSDPQMPARGGVPPEHQALAVVLSQVD